VNRKAMTWIFLALIALMCAGCSTDNTTSGGSQDTVKPPPQVRVEAMPTATVVFSAPTEAAAATLEPTAAPAQVYYPAPTPDEDAIMNQIDSTISDMNQKLNSQSLLLNP